MESACGERRMMAVAIGLREIVCPGGGAEAGFKYLVGLFFFSSRRRHTRCSRDWSSDVCSSDLLQRGGARGGARPNDVSQCEGRGACRGRPKGWSEHDGTYGRDRNDHPIPGSRSEERRVGEEGRSRWSPYH